jgi:hypothetical protein
MKCVLHPSLYFYDKSIMFTAKIWLLQHDQQEAATLFPVTKAKAFEMLELLASRIFTFFASTEATAEVESFFL